MREIAWLSVQTNALGMDILAWHWFQIMGIVALLSFVAASGSENVFTQLFFWFRWSFSPSFLFSFCLSISLPLLSRVFLRAWLTFLHSCLRRRVKIDLRNPFSFININHLVSILFCPISLAFYNIVSYSSFSYSFDQSSSRPRLSIAKERSEYRKNAKNEFCAQTRLD